MNSQLVAVIVTANLLLALVSVGRQVVFGARARFRCDVWKARDELLDAVQGGAVDDSSAVRRYIHRLSLVAMMAERWTPWRMYSATRTLRKTGYEPAPQWRPEAELDGAALAVVLDIQRRYHRALTRLLMFGSVSGWLTLPFLPLVVARGKRAWKHDDRTKTDELTEARKRRALEAPRTEVAAYAIQETGITLAPGDIAEVDEPKALAYSSRYPVSA